MLFNLTVRRENFKLRNGVFRLVGVVYNAHYKTVVKHRIARNKTCDFALKIERKLILCAESYLADIIFCTVGNRVSFAVCVNIHTAVWIFNFVYVCFKYFVRHYCRADFFVVRNKHRNNVALFYCGILNFISACVADNKLTVVYGIVKANALCSVKFIENFLWISVCNRNVNCGIRRNFDKIILAVGICVNKRNGAVYIALIFFKSVFGHSFVVNKHITVRKINLF